MEFFESHDLLCKEQHGFRTKRFTVTCLISAQKDSIHWLDNIYDVDTIYFDFCKAFDKVMHDRLIEKLTNYGCS